MRGKNLQQLIDLPFFVRASIISIGLFVFITALYLMQDILVPLIYSFLLAVILMPVVNFLVRKKINRVFAITTTLFAVIFLAILAVSLLYSQANLFSEAFPQLINKFQSLLKQIEIRFAVNFNVSEIKINAWIAELTQDILKERNWLIKETLTGTGNVLFVLILVPVYTFMILYYRPLLIEFIHKLFDTGSHGEVNEVLNSVKRITRGYLVGLFLEFVIVAVLNSIGLLVLEIKYAIYLGVIGALFNIIPYLGSVIAVSLPMMIAFATKASPIYVLFVFIIYLAIKFIDNNYIIPKIVASKVKINALVSIIAVLAGGALWGIPGMFLSIPVTAVAKVVFDHMETLKPWGFLLGDSFQKK